MYNTLRDMRKRQLAHQVLNLAMIVCSALMIWKSLMVVTSSESPVVVVLSGSMEPAFHRGDILFLHMGFTPFRAGDIVVFKVADRDIPIVHRVIKVHEKESGEVDLLTKGDNNAVDDRGLYAAGQSWINKEHVIGRAKGYLPYVSHLPPHAPHRRPLVSRSHSSHASSDARTWLVHVRPRADRDGDHHHERLPNGQVRTRGTDGALRANDQRMTRATCYVHLASRSGISLAREERACVRLGALPCPPRVRCEFIVQQLVALSTTRVRHVRESRQSVSRLALPGGAHRITER